MNTVRRRVSRIVVPVLVLAVAALTLPAAVFAQSDVAAGSAPSMRPGNIDIGLTGGIASLIYPYLEPQIAVGLVPLGAVTLSAGAVADVGYCLLCGLLRLVDNDWRLRSYYFGAYGRVLAHMTFLSDSVSALRLDPYAGLAVGPRFYFIGLEYLPSNASTTVTASTVIIAPQIGTRIFFSADSNFFAFAELRYLFEVGFQTQTVEVAGQSFTITGDYSSAGSNVGIGIGLRL